MAAQLGGDGDAAIAILERVPGRALAGDWAAQLHMILATNLAFAGRIEAAIVSFTRATGLGSTASQAVAGDLLATALWSAGHVDRALEVAEQAEAERSGALAPRQAPDNLPTDGGKEDHVSMGMTAALKLRRIVENVEAVVAIEFMAAAEGLEHRAPLAPGAGVRRAYTALRATCERLTRDRSLSDDIARVAEALRRGDFDL